jgi:transposase
VQERTRVLNRLEAIQQRPDICQYVLMDLESNLKGIGERIKACEDLMSGLVQEHYPRQYELLMSIKGIGPRIATMMIVLTEGFLRFTEAKKFSSFIGLSSFIRQSGTSLSTSSITKMGQSRLRHLLYMGSMPAMRWNSSCKEFSTRLLASGKPYKVVRVAVANKLIRQAFAVINKGEKYSEQYA